MVMRKKNVLVKNLLRTIRGSFGRYIAIVAIIALGASIFVGLISTKTDMVATGQMFMDKQNMFDLRLLSTYGWSQAEVDQVTKMDGVEYAEGAISMDVIGSRTGGERDLVYKLHSIPGKVNKVNLLGGRMPTSPDECLVDGHNATDAVLGSTFVISEDNEQGTLDALHVRTYTVVGYVSTPLYMDMSRGSTSIGNGVVTTYVYVPEESFNVDYYTEIDITLHGNYEVYTDAYNTAMEEMAEKLKPGVTVLAGERLAVLKADALSQYEDGLKEYEDGLKEYEDSKAEALSALDQALTELQNAQKEIDSNRQKLNDGLAQIHKGQKELDTQREKLQAGRIELATQKATVYAQLAAAYGEINANRKLVNDSLAQVKDGLTQIDSGLILLDDGISQIEDGLKQLDDGVEKLELGITLAKLQVKTLEQLLNAAGGADANNSVALGLKKELSDAQAELNGYVTQKEELLAMETELNSQLAELKQQRTDVLAQRSELLATKKTLQDALSAINDGLAEIQSNQAQADNEFAAAEAKIESGLLQLEAAQKELDKNRIAAEAGLAALNDGQAELDKAWAEYEAGKAEAEAKLAEGKAKLDDAAQKLADAKSEIDGMDHAEVYILDRNTNVGYLGLDNNSDIVAGVSRVFPAFFLLVAALVCVTTMTRMVEEERTQIGTFKALGYSKTAIIGKYMHYAGTASIIGCALGITIGSFMLPKILWDVYGILLNITPHLVMSIDFGLGTIVVMAYTVLMLLVTWFCCNRTLQEVPAELIRPKAPKCGKKIFLEYLPFWKHLSFLNKVMVRNVFRYRQRMLMMLLGVGGCTALLLTGFGLRDSIVNTVPNQFGEVSVYDMEVYFADGQTNEDQQAFRDALKGDVEGIHFFYQTSAELDFDNSISKVSLIVGGEGITDFIRFRQDGELLPLPKLGEVYLSIGVAEKMDIKVGDTVTVRDPDMKTLTLEVAGIFINNVQNFAIVAPETFQDQWGNCPIGQMAYVNVRQSVDVHDVSAKISGLGDVLTVSVMEDMANSVSHMLEALDTIVVVVILFAGTLAVIVLYNLTNINITERIREIATIKVLGFRASESAAYVFKENLLLSAMAVFVGLFMGNWLLSFVISQIKVDMIWIMPQIDFSSYILGIVLTMLSALLVDFLLYFKLERINMTEALKSVE